MISFVKGSNNVVLDVGCATGENGAYLLEKCLAVKVIGVESDVGMAHVAHRKLTNVIIGSVEKGATLAQISNKAPFDYILLGDVLEHLVDPWRTMRFLGTLLSYNGKIVASVPNVQHVDVFLNVFVKGYWPYNERGIFDKTHLRWFTLKNIYELVDVSDMEILELKRNYRYRDARNSKFPFYGKLLTSFFKNYYTFQYLFSCARRGQ